jgi:hypothetical protein
MMNQIATTPTKESCCDGGKCDANQRYDILKNTVGLLKNSDLGAAIRYLASVVRNQERAIEGLKNERHDTDVLPYGDGTCGEQGGDS